MVGAVVQGTGKARNNAGTAQAATFGSTPTAGNHIVVIAWLFSATSTAEFPTGGCADNKGNIYTRAALATRAVTVGYFKVALYYVENIASSATFTVTVTPSVVHGALVVEAYECSGLTTSSSLDQTATNTGTASGTATTGTTATTAQADELAFAAAALHAEGDPTTTGTENASGSDPVSGWTQRLEETDDNDYQAGNAVSLALTATGAIAHAWSNAENNWTHWAGLVVTFKAKPDAPLTFSPRVSRPRPFAPGLAR